MATPLDLVTDPVFLARVKLAFAAGAYQVATTPTQLPPDVRKAQLQALARVIEPSQAEELTKRAALLIVGSPEVLAAVDKITDQNLGLVVGKVLAAFQELAALGGSL